MIYEIYWGKVYSSWLGVDLGENALQLADAILDSELEDKFIFILSSRPGSHQSKEFERWLDTYPKLKDLIAFRPTYMTTNIVHSENGRVLQLVVMGKEKLMEGVEYGTTARNCTGEA